MAEDNMIALSLWHELGLGHAMTSDVACDFLGALTLQAYISRRARWIRVRRKMTLAATLAEPFTESIVCGLYGSWSIARLFGATASALWVLHMGAWLMLDLGVRRALSTNVSEPRGSTAGFVLAWMVREVLALPVWLYAMMGSVVVWRGQRYRILGSGECSERFG
jgi:ceramide glucosyltransferase